MKWSGFGSLLLVALVVAAVAGCASNTPVTPTEPTLTTETFSGTITTGLYTFFSFPGQAGKVTAKLSALSPNPTPPLQLTMAVGVYDAYTDSCQPASGSDTISVGGTVDALATAATSLCVAIKDSFNHIPSGVTEAFTLEVVHY